MSTHVHDTISTTQIYEIQSIGTVNVQAISRNILKMWENKHSKKNLTHMINIAHKALEREIGPYP